MDESPQLRPYLSPTLPSLLELGWLSLFGALLIVALGLPWYLIRVVNSNGLDFDTWKPIQAGAPPEWILPAGAKDLKMSSAGLLALYGEGLWALAKEHEDQASAVAAWSERWARGKWPPGVVGGATSVGGGQWLAFASMPDGRLLEWVSGRHILQFFAPNDRELSRMIAASSMIDARGEASYGRGSAPLGMRLLRFNARWTALLLNLLVLGGLAAAWWFGLRRYYIKPAAGARRLGREALRTRLLGLNTPNSPLRIEEQEPYHLICRWKLDDPQMAEWMSSRNLRHAWQLDIYLGDKSQAGVLETSGELSWDGRQSPPASSLRWNLLREVGQQHSAPTARASSTDTTDLETLVLPTQSVDPTDYRHLLRNLLLLSGWSWQPMLFRPLVWEYR